MPGKTAEPVQRSLDAISAGFGPEDEVALVKFDQFQTTMRDFTRSNDALFTQLNWLRLGSRISAPFAGPLISPPLINGRPIQGRLPSVTIVPTESKDIDDAVHYAGEMPRGKGRDRRKLIFLISDGDNSRRNEWSLNSTLDLLLSADISVYAIVAGFNPLHLEGLRMAHYATATGGDSYAASKQQDLERLYGQITEEARNQ